jgi:hypothetical protein
MDSFLNTHSLFEVNDIINFKNVRNTRDISKCNNGHVQRKVSQLSMAALGF